MIFITGEKIQFICDYFIGRISDFKFNPNVLKHNRHKCILLGIYKKKINNKPIVFCYTHALDDIKVLISTLQLMQNPFVLVFHNSDKNFDAKHLQLFDNLPLLK